MAIQTINNAKSICTSLQIGDAGITTIYEPQNLYIGQDYLPNYQLIGFNTFIKNLRVFSQITSLGVAPLPEIELTDSNTQKLVKVLDAEWQSERKQLNLYLSNNNIWKQIGSLSLLRPFGYPFRIYNIMSQYTNGLMLELGSDSRIGVQVQDVGYGLIASGDRVTVFGNYVEELILNGNFETKIQVDFNPPVINVNPNVNVETPIINVEFPDINIYNQLGGGTGVLPESSAMDNFNYIDNDFLIKN